MSIERYSSSSTPETSRESAWVATHKSPWHSEDETLSSKSCMAAAHRSRHSGNGEGLLCMSRSETGTSSSTLASLDLAITAMETNPCWFRWSIYGRFISHCGGCPFQMAWSSSHVYNDYDQDSSSSSKFVRKVWHTWTTSVWQRTTICIWRVWDLYEAEWGQTYQVLSVSPLIQWSSRKICSYFQASSSSWEGRQASRSKAGKFLDNVSSHTTCHNWGDTLQIILR